MLYELTKAMQAEKERMLLEALVEERAGDETVVDGGASVHELVSRLKGSGRWWGWTAG